MNAIRRQRKTFSTAPDPVEDLTIRVAHRICQIVYSRCDCKQRGSNQVCDNMKAAAQHAFWEIKDYK